MAMARVFLCAVVSVGFPLYCFANFYPSLLWTPENPKFNTSMGNFKMSVHLNYKVNLICPNTATIISQRESSLQRAQLYENIWIVDRKSWQSCHVDTSNTKNKKLMDCDAPLQLNYYTLVFQSFTAEKWDPVFEKGKSYFLIATSNGSKISLDSTSNGHCKQGMKMEIYVCRDDEDCKTTEALTTAPTVSQKTMIPIRKSLDSSPHHEVNNSPGSDNTPMATTEPSITLATTDEPIEPKAAESRKPGRKGTTHNPSVALYVLVVVLSVLLIVCIIAILILLRKLKIAKQSPKECTLEFPETRPLQECNI